MTTGPALPDATIAKLGGEDYSNTSNAFSLARDIIELIDYRLYTKALIINFETKFVVAWFTFILYCDAFVSRCMYV